MTRVERGLIWVPQEVLRLEIWVPTPRKSTDFQLEGLSSNVFESVNLHKNGDVSQIPRTPEKVQWKCFQGRKQWESKDLKVAQIWHTHDGIGSTEPANESKQFFMVHKSTTKEVDEPKFNHVLGIFWGSILNDPCFFLRSSSSTTPGPRFRWKVLILLYCFFKLQQTHHTVDGKKNLHHLGCPKKVLIRKYKTNILRHPKWCKILFHQQ